MRIYPRLLCLIGPAGAPAADEGARDGPRVHLPAGHWEQPAGGQAEQALHCGTGDTGGARRPPLLQGQGQ
eukprot:8897854-Pyramimonas_sp.AAC.1